MTERPIRFLTDMVKAILEGRKTMTRRVIKPQPIKRTDYCGGYILETKKATTSIKSFNEGLYQDICPFGKVGDKLWVRETWDFRPMAGRSAIIGYKADRSSKGFTVPEGFNQLVYEPTRYRPSIHMPKWASRITLEILDIRVEKLHQIEDKDCYAEGINCFEAQHLPEPHLTPTEVFRNLWNSLHKKQYRWEDNPWVWCISFKRLQWSIAPSFLNRKRRRSE